MARLELQMQERIDWFRVIVDIEKKGITTTDIGRQLKIPQSTLTGWKLEHHRPKFEEGLRLLNLWCRLTKKYLEWAPRHDPTKPHLRFSQHHQPRAIYSVSAIAVLSDLD